MTCIMFTANPQNYSITNNPQEAKHDGTQDSDLSLLLSQGSLATLHEGSNGYGNDKQDACHSIDNTAPNDFVFYDDPYRLYCDLSEGIYYFLADKPNVGYAFHCLSLLKKKLSQQRSFPFSQEQVNEVYSLIDLVYELHGLNRQIEAETDAVKKEVLKSHYQEKMEILRKDCPSIVDERLELDWYLENFKERKKEALRLFPDDYEVRANYLEQF